MPTLPSNRQLEKLAISVKIQKWTRPSKDSINKVNQAVQLGVARLLFMYGSKYMPEKGSKTGVWYNCEWCGQKKYMNTYHYNKMKHHFCSNECSVAWHHSIAYEHRSCEICGKDMYVLKKSPQRFCGARVSIRMAKDKNRL